VASVEQTINTYDDGAVLGSLIVLLSTDGKTLDAQVITDDQGHPTPIKVEGITWLNTHPSGEEFYWLPIVMVVTRNCSEYLW